MSQLISGLIGVFVGALLAAFIQWITHRYTTRQRRQHLILLVCSILDDFCSACREAMEEEENAFTDTGRFKVPTPTAPRVPVRDWTGRPSIKTLCSGFWLYGPPCGASMSVWMRDGSLRWTPRKCSRAAERSAES